MSVDLRAQQVVFNYPFRLILILSYHRASIVGSPMGHCIMKKIYNQLYLQSLINHTSDLIMKSKFFEVFRSFRGIDLLKKCMDISCVELISDMGKI